MADVPPSEKTVRNSVKRIRKEAARLRDRLKESSVKIATLDDAATHPERIISSLRRAPKK